MAQMLKHWFTSRDNATWSMTKLIAAGAAITAIVQFFRLKSVDFQGFGIGMSTLIAALAAKYHVEDK